MVDTTTGAKTELTPRDAKEKIFYGDAQFSKDGKGVYVTSDKDSEFNGCPISIWRRSNPNF